MTQPRSVVIVGSGPSAAAAALALAKVEGCHITVIDIGLKLETPNQAAVQRLASEGPDQWKPDDLALITARPVKSDTPGLPEKRAYGSDFPFRDAGQEAGVETADGVHDRLISGAYGGFSAVWGSVILPFPREAFDGWPVEAHEMRAHYRAVLSQIPYAAVMDDLAEELPLHASAAPLPPLSERAQSILAGYGRHRVSLRREGVLMGRARLALKSADCVRCGLCMSGCPYGLIYSAAHTFDELSHTGRITYRPNLLAIRLEQDGTRPAVIASDLSTGQAHRFEADRIYVACGAIGTTRLVLASLQRYDTEIELQESTQFVLPFVSRRATVDPRHETVNTLGQICALLNLPQLTAEPAHLQLYTYNASFDDALPGFARPLAGQALRRITVGLGYLPSSISPRLRVRLTGEGRSGGLPGMRISADDGIRKDPLVLRAIGRLLLRAAPRLDLWPVLPRLALSAPGKSYHWGGSFGHAAGNRSEFRTDRMGRLAAWNRIHLVDPSVMPSIAATTFTLTAMANAHRIAEESLALEDAA